MPTVFEVSAGAWEVAVLPGLGARLHGLRYAGVDLLRTPPDPSSHVDEPGSWGGFVLAPWCNRIHRRDAEVLGRALGLDANFDDGTAIHGQVAATPWDVIGDGAFRIEAGGDGWPWRYEVNEEVEVSDAGVQLRLSLRNLDDGPMPAGLGIHPWYAGNVAVQVPADEVMADNTSRVDPFEPVRGDLDLRTPRPVPAGADATWTGLADPRVHLRTPRLPGVVVVHEFSAGAGFVTAARKDELDATAVEPQTHAPDGLERLLADARGGLAVLGSGETLSVHYRWAVGDC